MSKTRRIGTAIAALTLATGISVGTAAPAMAANPGGAYMYVAGQANCHAYAKDAQSQGFTVTAWCLPSGNNMYFLHFNY
jgi:hypothetical protein